MPIRVLSMDKSEGFTNTKAFAGANMNSNDAQNNPSAEYQLNSPFTTRSNAWGSSSIWSGPVPNGLSSKTGTRDSSRNRENSQQSLSNTIGDIEGKTGSASLVESSVSDEGLYPTTWGTKRPGPSNSVSSGRAISQATYNEPQTRGNSIPGLPQAFGNVMHNSQAFAQGTRPPTINLTSTSAFHSRPNINSSFSGDTTDRGEQGGPPWNVYTKLSRPSEPTQRKPDSAVSGWFDSSTTPSPSDERRPQGNNLYSRNANIAVSRESSMASPGQMDEPLVFTHPDYSRPSQHVTPASSRAPSMSSRNGAFGNYLAPAADTVASQFSKLNLNSDSRPSTSYKSIGGHSSHPSAVSVISSFSRSSFPTPASDRTKQDYFGEGDQSSMGHRQADSYSSQTALVPYTGYQSPAQSQRYPQNYGNNFEMRPNQGFANSPYQPRPHEYYSAKSSPNNHSVPPSRRSANVSDVQVCYDPRMASQLHSQFAAMYPQYQVPPMPHGAPSPFLSYGLSNLEVAPIVAHQQMQPRDLSSTEAVQSALLTEFKSNANKSKRFELRDIYDHISEFSGDQYGSRFIQTKLETANSDEKERVFKEIEPNAIQLMTDVFGNYVIQKLFEHGDQRHKKILANKMRNRVLNLSLQMYGCRVVQKALDHVLVDQQAQLVRELDSFVVRCVKDQHGNHVIQKAIERCPVSSIEFVISAFRGQVQHLSIHPYGCRVIQRCLEKGDPSTNAMILSELMDSIPSMIQDQYGNYVVQHIVCHDDGEAKQRVLHIVAQNLECYSKHKFASNVVEKCLERSDDYWRRSVVYDLVQGSQMRPEEGAVVSMIKDNYGNYVIQKLMDTLSGDDHRAFLDILRPAMNAAKRNGCGKQVLAIDKKMHRFPTVPAGNGTYGQHGYHATLQITYGSNYNSTGATPPPPALTADSQSFQSSRMPSINGDTVEGAMAERASHEHSGMNGLQK